MAKKRGRPAHADDPPVKLMTTIPASVDAILDDLKDKTGRPRSEIIAAAIRAYAKRKK